METIVSNRTDDAKLWMLWLVDTLPSMELACVLVMMWVISWSRRRAIHDDQYQSPLSTHMFIEKFLSELEAIPDGKERPRDRNAKSKDLHVTPRDVHVMPREDSVQRDRSVQPVWLPPAKHDVEC